MPPTAAYTSARDASSGSHPLRSNSHAATLPAARNASARQMPKMWMGMGPMWRSSGIKARAASVADVPGRCYKARVRAVVQRVREARVTIDGEIVGAIERGLCVLVGVSVTDTEADA